MLPKLGSNLGQLPRALKVVRELEAFEGPILSELSADGGGSYLEKWCSKDESKTRTLIVRTEQRAVVEYLAGRMTMLRLLMGPSDGVGFVVDRQNDDQIVAVYLQQLSQLPPGYLPKPTALHDSSLRPDWTKVPQSFLVPAEWDAKLLATIERKYLDVYGFSYFTDPSEVARQLPPSVLKFSFDGGYPLMHAFNHVRAAIPGPVRARSVGVSANSPGVLTMEAPSRCVAHLMKALTALQKDNIGNAYDTLWSWSRLKWKRTDLVPASAEADLRRFCDLLIVDAAKLLPTEPVGDEKLALLVGGKLVASYYRRLWAILGMDDGFEFVDAGGAPGEPPVALSEETDDDEDDLG